MAAMRVCLVEPGCGKYRFDYIPTGLFSIAAVLIGAGHKVTVHRDTDNIPPCDILGVSATAGQYYDALRVMHCADAGLKVIGGACPTSAIQSVMASKLIDIGIVGDGELAMLSIAERKDPGNIAGIAHRKGGAVFVNPNLDFCYSLGEMLMPVYPYEQWELGTSVNVFKSREWSWNGKWYNRNRVKNWRWFRTEISLLRSLGVRSAVVTDENFSNWGSARKTVEVLDTLDWWECRSGVRNALDRRLDQLLRGSHCRKVELNIVSGSDRMLEEHKDFTLADTELTTELLEYSGIDVQFHAIIGLPGETICSMEDTMKWLYGKQARIATYIPYPGCEYGQKAESFGFHVTGTHFEDFYVDDTKPISRLPWKCNTITTEDFIGLRNRMVKEFNDDSTTLN